MEAKTIKKYVYYIIVGICTLFCIISIIGMTSDDATNDTVTGALITLIFFLIIDFVFSYLLIKNRLKLKKPHTKQEHIAGTLCLLGFIGLNGLHDFYLKKYLLGIIKFFTFNFFFIGIIIDLIKIYNEEYIKTNDAVEFTQKTKKIKDESDSNYIKNEKVYPECVICNKDVKGLFKRKCSDGYICAECIKQCRPEDSNQVSRMDKEEILGSIKERKKQIDLSDNFVATKSVGKYFAIDERTKQWTIPANVSIFDKVKKIYQFKDIVTFELLEDGDTLTKGGLGRAVAGGLLFGDVGAIVGGVTGCKKSRSFVRSMDIKITLNNITTPSAYIKIINSEIKKGTFVYKAAIKNAQEILSLLSIINKENEKDQNIKLEKVDSNFSKADELSKLKQLHDEGTIDDVEFQKMKEDLMK